MNIYWGGSEGSAGIDFCFLYLLRIGPCDVFSVLKYNTRTREFLYILLCENIVSDSSRLLGNL